MKKTLRKGKRRRKNKTYKKKIIIAGMVCW